MALYYVRDVFVLRHRATPVSHSSPGVLGFQLQRKLRRMETTVTNGHGDEVKVAQAGIRYLYKIQDLGSNLQVLSTELTPAFRVVNDYTSREELTKRRATLSNLVAAIIQFDNYVRSGKENYHEELLKTGLPTSALNLADENFAESFGPSITKASHGLAKAWALSQDQYFGFLETNWGKWEFQKSRHLVSFTNQNLELENEELRREVDRKQLEWEEGTSQRRSAGSSR